MVSRSGYQEGAITAAKSKGILLLTEGDLPTFNKILAKKIEHIFLPNENVIGEPFWTIMEYVEDSAITGTYYCLPGSTHENYKIALFYSKRVAEAYCTLVKDKCLAVRGMNQAQLRGLIEFSKIHKLSFHLAIFEPDKPNEWMFIELPKEVLINDYVIE